LLAEHCPHAPPAWQAGVAPPQSPSPRHATHALFTHAGLAPEQSVLARHATHWLVAVSHRGVPPLQVASVVHCTHWPALHTGVVPPQAT
jgi:hypothetical protein